MDQGYYEYEGKRIDIQSDMDASIRSSVLITPTQGAELLEKYSRNDSSGIPDERVENLSTVDAIRKLAKEGRSSIGVLNFASAKNPGAVSSTARWRRKRVSRHQAPCTGR